ncbi:MAG: VOC family protein [Deltaproteobacteria bacterium]|nr:VOC family protein [Deltaproteobacteria bacterium]
MKIKRIEHVGINVGSLETSKRLWEECFGISIGEVSRPKKIPIEIAMYPIGESMVELVAGTTPESIIPESNRGINHICFEVENIDEAIAELKEKGIRLAKLFTDGPRIGHGGCRVVFLDTADTDNCLIELAELPRS